MPKSEKSHKNQVENPILKGLNPVQKTAVLAGNGPVLIVAGAGSGKTRVLASRAAYLISQGVKPENILALTFTNKAAREMKERIQGLLESGSRKPEADSVWAGTFHSLGAKILREKHKYAGLSRNFSILDEEDSLDLFKESLRILEIDPKQFQPVRIQNIVSLKKGEAKTLEDFKKESKEEFFPEKIAQIWEVYENLLAKVQGVDFDDLLLKPIIMFQKYPEVLKEYREKWRYILIDEYQDTNFSQYVLSRLLAKEHKNICAIGDIDQAIYSWRGADFRNILRFEKDWPDAKVFVLEENYRSTKVILDAANAVIAQNKERKDKNLFTQQPGGEKIELFQAASAEGEAEFIAAKAAELIEGGADPEQIAVLFRTNFQSRLLEEKFLNFGVPHQVIGVRFYNRREIKDILAFLKSVLNPEDFLSKGRIINVPPRGIGKISQAKYMGGVELSAAEKSKIIFFEILMEEIKEKVGKEPVSKAIDFILERTGYLKLFDQNSEEGMMRIGNVKELADLSKRFDKLEPPNGILALLEEASLMSEQDAVKNEQRASLMTIHSAKGLEFDYVFIAGLEEGLFPHVLSRISPDESSLEEERRLFYVALTRARKKLFLTFSNFRHLFGARQSNLPSKFISEIPPHLFKSNGGDEETIIKQ